MSTQNTTLEEQVASFAPQIIKLRQPDRAGRTTEINIDGRVYGIFHTAVNQFLYREDTHTVLYQSWFYTTQQLSEESAWRPVADDQQMQEFLSDVPRIMSALSHGPRTPERDALS